MARAWISTTPQLLPGSEDPARGADIQYHRIQQRIDAHGECFVDKPLGISRAGQILLENFQTKSVMDALL